MQTGKRIPNDLLNQLKNNNIFPSDLVFYITSACNLRCKHCYIGNTLLAQEEFFNLEDSIKFINSFLHLDRVTILGGEPLLYRDIDLLLNSLQLTKINELRLTTNLTNIDKFESFNQDVKNKIRVCVSLDGYNEEIHDYVRGKGSFNKTIKNLALILKEQIDVEVNHTLTQKNIGEFRKFIDLCISMNVKKVNIHLISLQGNALKNQALKVNPTEYVNFCKQLRTMSCDVSKISVRFPLSFADEKTYAELVEKFDYKPHAFKSYYGNEQRVVIYPTGQIFISSEFFGTEAHIGTFNESSFHFNDSEKNELLFFQKSTSKISDINPYQKGDENYPITLSVSYKETIFIS